MLFDFLTFYILYLYFLTLFSPKVGYAFNQNNIFALLRNIGFLAI